MFCVLAMGQIIPKLKTVLVIANLVQRKILKELKHLYVILLHTKIKIKFIFREIQKNPLLNSIRFTMYKIE